MYQPAAPKSVRRGVTMIELLVVVTIIVMLLAIAIPYMGPVSQERRVREAARGVNVYFGNARNRAMETGRAHGVTFERLPRQPQACVRLRQSEVPLPYAGDTPFAGVRPFPAISQPVPWIDPATQRRHYYVLLQLFPGDFSNQLIRRGDLIQLNHQGPWHMVAEYPADNTPSDTFEPPATNAGQDFPLVDPAADPQRYAERYVNFYPSTLATGADGWIISHWLAIEVNPINDCDLPWGTSSSRAVPFEILRQPVSSAVTPLQLARGAIVDLGASGNDMAPAGFAPVDSDGDPSNGVQDPSTVTILFSPTGMVDRLIVQGVQSRVTEPIYLLVGKWERAPLQPGGPAQADDGLHNWEDAGNLWVALSPQTGLATVAELNANVQDPATNVFRPSDLSTARKFAREAQISMGGR